MLLLSLPIFFMKFVVLYPDETAPRAISSIKMIIQIAGLSYIVFKAIGMYLDIWRKPGFVNVLDFYNFLTFVPTLLIGPLDRFERFNTDIKNGYASVNTSMYGKAWNNFILGLLFKFILAEAVRRLVLSQLVDDGSFGYHVSYMYTYLFYLFFDFAGYSLLAIGFGNFLGIDVPINFDKPFLSVNPKEFWKRWHKSLGDWLGDYFFKPIFKYFTSKKIFESMQRQSIALFLTFTLMGFWNGFELHYIVSGMLFGVYSMVHNYYANQCKKQKKDVFFGNLNEKWVRVLSICIMFNLVAIAIYIFSGNLF
jgi:membrane protein involved in D-alanine export